ncbi:transcriptional regulator WhiB-like [Propionibacterium phage PFR2]|uniref:4Fe-4S Wbl-type domain-containing protein n=2 Tax=Pulverervirus PFR1 TaxID=2170091 RepID=A0A173G9I6_9CAUD|nr:WhiB family transcriptional regulator [Propionibacterium freudenreichii]YP_009287713.1 transcriptional regulator WhiB-like [Propionibacterium phage PFR1]YP_009290946.1 transcriptional regulator WhiB-like [Propionibacterium phage PFR2]ANH49903.1 hypothetical protein PFR_37 [Propionibacterium phage PFR1]ANH49962.1 hypothetical protein PFR2_37 [Propionibacterium phage PFR2]CEI46721.1 WhiB family transcriptional regulator [Propionibacterium freudenreichii]SCQ46807.1 Hypothetical protein PFR_JS
MKLTGLMAVMPAWVSDAACSPEDAEDWQAPDASPQSERALRVCRGCPVRLQCLAAAMERPEAGIWGGLTESDRERVQHGMTVARVSEIRRHRAGLGKVA